MTDSPTPHDITSAEKVVAGLRRRAYSSQSLIGKRFFEEAAALIESQREDRDSWRRVAERLEEEKRAAEARVTALEAEKAGLVEALSRLPDDLERWKAVQRRYSGTDAGYALVGLIGFIEAARQALSRSSTEVKNDGA